MKKLLAVLFVISLLIVAAIVLLGIYGGKIHRWSMGWGADYERPDPVFPDVSKTLSAESIKEFEEREADLAVERADEERADP